MVRGRVLVIILLIYAVAEADIYKYVGEDGVVFYTDAPLLKGKAKKVIKDKSEDEKESVSSGKKENRPGHYATQQNTDNDYNHIIHKKAKENEIDPSLVTAVIKTESNGNPYAVSKKGAMGLMQLMPVTANELQVRDPYDPEENIDGGTRYLRYLIERFDGNLSLALAAYNAGPKVVEKHGCIPPISETKQYVKKVLAIYKGKTDVSFSGKPKAKKSEPIYKIVMEDGTILFTNCPISKTNLIRF